MHTNTIDRRNFLAILSAITGSAALATPAFARFNLLGSAESAILSWDTLHKAGFHVMADQTTGGNVLVATSKLQTLLIDTKFAHFAGALVQDAKAFAGPQDKFDLTLINTHHHADHTGGNAMVVPLTTASYAHANAMPRIESQLERTKQSAASGPAQVNRAKGSQAWLKQALQAAGDSSGWTTKHILPTTAVQDHASFTLGDTKVAMHHFGNGHTDNDLVVHFEDSNIIHTGDLVFAGLHPFMDTSAGVTAIGWTNSLTAILELCDDDTIVIPGHGSVGNKQTVTDQLNYLNQLIKHVQADIDASVSKEDSAKNTWDFMEGLGFEQIRSRAIEATYDELDG